MIISLDEMLVHLMIFSETGILLGKPNDIATERDDCMSDLQRIKTKKMKLRLIF